MAERHTYQLFDTVLECGGRFGTEEREQREQRGTSSEDRPSPSLSNIALAETHRRLEGAGGRTGGLGGEGRRVRGERGADRQDRQDPEAHFGKQCGNAALDEKVCAESRVPKKVCVKSLESRGLVNRHKLFQFVKNPPNASMLYELVRPTTM